MLKGTHQNPKTIEKIRQANMIKNLTDGAKQGNYILKIPSTISKVETLVDGGLKLTVHTQELDPTDEAVVMQLKRKLGWLVFSVAEHITIEDIPTEQLEFAGDKSPGQRLRAVMYRLWEQDKRGYAEFELFYSAKMGKIIETLKEKLL